MEGSPVQLALVDVTGALPEGDLTSLMNNGSIEELAEEDATALSGKVRKGILIALDAQNLTWGKGVARRWRYRINTEIPSMNFTGGFRLPFTVNAHSEIELARVFSGNGAAAQASPLTIQHLPYNVQSALALPVGSVVTVPIHGRMALDASGAFLTRAAQHSPELSPHLSTSVMGSLSGVRQGTLVGEGRFQLQFIRLQDDKVRVRVFAGSDVSGNLGGVGSVAGAISYAFIPLAIVDRALAIRKRVEEFGASITKRTSATERSLELYARLPGQLKLVFDHLPSGEMAEENWIHQLAGSQEDGALSVLAQGGASLQSLQSTIKSRVDSMLDTVTIPWKNRIQPMVGKVQKWSSRVLSLHGTVVLSQPFSRKVRTMGDYTFDLSDPAAQEAFERAISGRTAMIGAFQGIDGSSVTDALYGDLTLAESIAEEDEGSMAPRIKREALAFGDMTEKKVSARVNGLWMSSGTDVSSNTNQFLLIDEEGQSHQWMAQAWELVRDVTWWTGSTKEAVASGSFLNASSNDNDAGYWMSWEKKYPDSAADPVKLALGEAINLGGPVALKAGVPALYSGEYPGTVTAKVQLAISDQGLGLLFDPELTTDSLLWAVFASVAESFDNQFGLPYLATFQRPSGLSNIPGGENACEVVAKHFGGHYCFFFANDFIPALRAVQDGTGPHNRSEFLADYYKRGGWMGNPIGSRVLVRFLTTLLYALDAEEEVTLQVDIHNDRNQSEAASPKLMKGDPEELTKIRLMTPEGIR